MGYTTNIMLTDFADAHAALARYMPPPGTLKQVYTLTRMRKLMAMLGNPQNSLRVIHVAGTSGKTSTCYYMAAMLKAAGKKVGLTVSPHVSELNERVQIGLEPLDEADFCRRLTVFLRIVEDSGITPTYFEIMVAFAYWIFAQEGVEYAVVEVGLGGLKDGTNVVRRTDKICLITDIGYDHMHVLGRTLAAIAAQKAGIITKGNHVFSYSQPLEVRSVLEERVHARSAMLHTVKPGSSRSLPDDMALFQTRNWFLAKAVYDYLMERDGLPKLAREALLASARTYIPGRMEVFRVGTKTLVLDGAHNPQKMKALTVSLKELFPDAAVACLFAFVSYREDRLKDTLEQLTWVAGHLIATSFTSDQELRKKSLPPEVAVRACQELGFDAIEIVSDPDEALDRLLDRPEPVLLVTGSFYLISRLRQPAISKGMAR